MLDNVRLTQYCVLSYPSFTPTEYTDHSAGVTGYGPCEHVREAQGKAVGFRDEMYPNRERRVATSVLISNDDLNS